MGPLPSVDQDEEKEELGASGASTAGGKVWLHPLVLFLLSPAFNVFDTTLLW
jgi:hypothetical protein